MKRLLTAYKILATVVGISIITLVLVGVPLKYAHDLFPDFWPSMLQDGSPLQAFGAGINLYLGIAHGYIYMAFLLVALGLAARAKWPIVFTVVTLLCGTIPVLSFWAERRAVRKVEAEHPDQVGPGRGVRTAN